MPLLRFWNLSEEQTKYLRSYIRTVQSREKKFFTKEEAISILDISNTQFLLQAHRLQKHRKIRRLIKSFYMIIPDEYATLGSLPPHWIIGPLMNYLNQDYYIGLLSAASFYGATEQQPMIFQVITNKTTKKIFLPRGGIQCYVNKKISLAQTTTITTSTGYANISTKEQTLIDLVKYHKASGYLSNVADVIKELSEECVPTALSQVVKHANTTVLQRLGHILELCKKQDLTKVIEQELLTRKMQYILLRPEFPGKTGPKIEKWKLINNDPLEI